jgi:hypothetical protein
MLTAKQLYIIKQLDNLVNTLNSLNLTTIFALYTTPELQAILEKDTKYPLFSFAAATGLVNAATSLLELSTNKKDPELIVNATVEVLAALTIGTTVSCSLSGVSYVAKNAATIFTAVVAAKTLLLAGTAALYTHRACNEPSAAIRSEHRAKAILNGIGTVSAGTSACTMIPTMNYQVRPTAWAAAASSLVGAGLSIFKIIKTKKPEAQPTAHPTERTLLIQNV